MKNASMDRPAGQAESPANPHECSFLPGLLLAIFCMLAQGCGTAPPATQIIEVPVYTPCVKDMPPAPAFEFDKLPLDAPDGAKVLALARDWPRGRTYEGKLEAAIAGCLPIQTSYNAESAAPQSIHP